MRNLQTRRRLVFLWLAGVCALVASGPVHAQERDGTQYDPISLEEAARRLERIANERPAPSDASPDKTHSAEVKEPASDPLARWRKDSADANAETDPASPSPEATEPQSLEQSFAHYHALADQALRERLPRFLDGALDDLNHRRYTRRLAIAASAAGVLGILLLTGLARLVRGRGGATICVEYPPEFRGTFSVRLSTRRANQGKTGRIHTPGDADRAMNRASNSNRTEHHMVSRETQFLKVSTGRYFVTVDGFLQTVDSDDVIDTRFEEREVRVGRGRSQRIEFDFRPKACRIEVRVSWDRRPVSEALIALRGAPHSLRVARGGSARLSLGEGKQTVVVGSSDRVAEFPLEIRSLQPIQLQVDLAEREHLLFTGCPPAVQPYLNGDVPGAARELEREGQIELSHLLRARFHQEREQHESAAKHFESAGHLVEAAELRQELSQFREAARLYEQAGEDECAAELYRSGGDLVRAGEAYARTESYDKAVQCFRKAKELPRLIDVLLKSGAAIEAAKVALENKDLSRAIQCLNEVLVTDTDYPDAALQLAQLYESEGHVDLATRKLEELVATRGPEEAPLAALDLLAHQLEGSGEIERALQMLEKLRDRDAAYPSVATRIEGLRKRRSSQQSSSGAITAPVPSSFPSESRYEILEEVGRGGMGIVFRARDRRLGRTVALKQLPSNLRDHPRAVDLFLREARAAAALNHPNIVTLFDAGEEGETYYITMELLEGQPLNRLLRVRGKLSAAHVVKLGGQIATGLQYAHEQGVIHRDIKTANLFFTSKRLVKIMDFGLAKMVAEVRGSTTVIGGTPFYMAPEQAAGGRVDHRADLYALGITFYELLTGAVPFHEGDVAFHHRHTAAPDPREKAPDVPEALVQLVYDLLAKKVEERCPSSAQVLERLQQIARAL